MLAARLMLLVALLAVLACFGNIKAARGHGSASWIMEDPRTSWCCGPNDCGPLPDGTVERVDDNTWRYKPSGQVFKRGGPSVYQSINNEFWGCTINPPGLRCFFYPTEIG